MAYTPTEWENGDALAATKFNKMENGLKSADSSYVPTEWTPGDVITAEALNKIENGIAAAGSGGGGNPVAEEKDVNFIDYDGTIRYSYTAQEFAALDALPANPSHDGLTAQGWNWSLSDAKTYVAANGKLWIGQMYITTDGKTHVYIHLDEGRLSPMLGCCPNGTVVVDWGDGSATTTLTGTSLSTAEWTSTHNYAAPGDYEITLNVTSGTMALEGSSSNNEFSYLLRYSSSADSRNNAYKNAIKRVEIGANTSIFSSAFYNCFSLSSITIPSGVTSIGSKAFYSCDSLSSITIPSNVTSIGADAFSYCLSLSSITIPGGVTSIGSNAFRYCYSLQSITIPGSVTSIGDYAFQYCYSLQIITIPGSVTSIGTYAFQYCYSLQIITTPGSVTKINTYAFHSCVSLSSITIPSGVTSIGTYAFQSCFSLGAIHFKPTTPPTVASSNAWTNVPTDCIIYVPTGSLSAYTSASNYPSSSTYTYREE